MPSTDTRYSSSTESASQPATEASMPKVPLLRVLQSGGDVQVINVHFETHNDPHVLIKLLAFCVLVVLLLLTVFVFFGNGLLLDSSLSANGTSRVEVGKAIFINYRSIVAGVWLIWFGVFCFWCWFARLAWGDVAVPEKCVVGFRRVRECSTVCWLPSTAGTQAGAGSDDGPQSTPRWRLRVARPSQPER